MSYISPPHHSNTSPCIFVPSSSICIYAHVFLLVIYVINPLPSHLCESPALNSSNAVLPARASAKQRYVLLVNRKMATVCPRARAQELVHCLESAHCLAESPKTVSRVYSPPRSLKVRCCHVSAEVRNEHWAYRHVKRVSKAMTPACWTAVAC